MFQFFSDFKWIEYLLSLYYVCNSDIPSVLTVLKPEDSKITLLSLLAIEKHFLNTHQQSCSGKRRLFENVCVANSMILPRHKRTTFMSISRNSSFYGIQVHIF